MADHGRSGQIVPPRAPLAALTSWCAPRAQLCGSCRGTDWTNFYHWAFVATHAALATAVNHGSPNPTLTRAAARLPGEVAARLLTTLYGNGPAERTHAALARFLGGGSGGRWVSRDDWAVMSHFLDEFPEVSQLAGIDVMERGFPSLLDDFVEQAQEGQRELP